MNKDEIAALLVTSDQDLVRAMEAEFHLERETDPDKRRLMIRIVNLMRKGAGMPEVAVQ
jgi:hypothetical protein